MDLQPRFDLAFARALTNILALTQNARTDVMNDNSDAQNSFDEDVFRQLGFGARRHDMVEKGC